MKPIPHVRCPRVDPRELSANASDAFWQAIAPAAFCEVQTGAAPEQATEVRLAWTKDDLHVLLHATDRHVWATLTERDGPLWEEEVLEVFLDPVGDAESYFEIEVNPLGTVVDLVCRRSRSGYKKDFAWDCEGLRTAVQRWENGWTAELAIPFRALVADLPQAGVQWRANFCRIDRPMERERELTAWSHTGLRLFHVPGRFGVVEFGA